MGVEWPNESPYPGIGCQGLDDGEANVNYLAGGVAILLGLGCLGVAGEALRQGRIWYRSKNRPDPNSRWVYRST